MHNNSGKYLQGATGMNRKRILRRNLNIVLSVAAILERRGATASMNHVVMVFSQRIDSCVCLHLGIVF